MPEYVKKLLGELKLGLIDLYGNRLKAVYLFGSYARGDFHAGSDVDVMIVLSEFHTYWEELERSADLFSSLSLTYDLTVSRTIVNEEQWLHGDLPVLKNIRAEGIAA